MMDIYKLYTVLFILFFLAGATSGWSQATEYQPAKPPLPEEWFLATGDWQNDPRLFVKGIGSGKDTVIMLHGGWGGEHRGMIPAIDGLEEDYFFVFYDQRGSLRSPFPDSLITFAAHIEDLERLRSTLGLQSFKLVGHSMGSILACAYHNKYPDRVEKLILLAPAPLKIPLPAEDAALKDQSNRALQTFLERPAVVAALDRFNLQRTEPPLSSVESTIRFRIYGAARFLYDVGKWTTLKGGYPFYQPRVYGLTEQSIPNAPRDYIQRIAATGIPASVIIGDHDFLDMGAKIIGKWVKPLPNVDLTIVPEAGHNIWTDQPAKFARAFRAALSK